MTIVFIKIMDPPLSRLGSDYLNTSYYLKPPTVLALSFFSFSSLAFG